jgi:hypothetical protein
MGPIRGLREARDERRADPCLPVTVSEAPNPQRGHGTTGGSTPDGAQLLALVQRRRHDFSFVTSHLMPRLRRDAMDTFRDGEIDVRCGRRRSRELHRVNALGLVTEIRGRGPGAAQCSSLHASPPRQQPSPIPLIQRSLIASAPRTIEARAGLPATRMPGQLASRSPFPSGQASSLHGRQLGSTGETSVVLQLRRSTLQTPACPDGERPPCTPDRSGPSTRGEGDATSSSPPLA